MNLKNKIEEVSFVAREEAATLEAEIASPPLRRTFWTPWRTCLTGFTLASVVALGYSTVTEKEIYWPGLFMMLGFYALFYYVGAKSTEKKRDDDMLVAGRSMPLWIAMFTMTATWVGGGYITGTSENVYNYGMVWTQAPWAFSISLILGGIFYARKMRRYEFMTMLDPLESRFGKRMGGLLYFPALLGEVFCIAAYLTALGMTFGVILGLDFKVSIIFSAFIAIAYTVIGGLWAIAHTDVLQLCIMFVGLIFVLPFAFANVGGIEVAFSKYAEGMGDTLSLFPPLMGWTDPNWGNYYWQWWDFALLLMLGGIPWQIYFQRVLAAKNENTAMWLSISAGLVCMLAAVPPALIGIAGYNADWSALGTSAPENPSMILSYVFKFMSPGLVGSLALGGLAAAVIGSVAASMLSASSMAAWNVYRPLVKPNANKIQLDKMIKRCIIIVGVGSTIIALSAKSVYALWYLSSDLVYCILFPQLTLALFNKGVNTYGSAAGFAVALLLRVGGGEPLLGLPPFLPYPMIEDGVVLFPFRTFAMVSSLMTIITVSYFTRKICPPMPLRNLETGKLHM
ncbi:sodium:solute symporter family protein [Ammoniphilus sp. YIM 78166]|uniref:sodium:solute symporter family protein n=1 Tax=Ammoniphilus sp. YIM 78166 TaxID=1644106 RepID=UPI00106F4C98|nr:sodium:solute symporter family protein [Ammoniphilus sp. YIM 78166]